MAAKSWGMRSMNSIVTLFLVASLSILNIHTPTVQAEENKATREEVKNADAVTAVETETVETTSTQIQPPIKVPQVDTPDPKTTKTSSSGKTLMYAGIGIAAVAAVAAAAGSGGGSSDTASTASDSETPTPTLKPVGADIGGKTWAGSLNLIDGVKESVTATVNQNGAAVEITTSSTQQYGHKFIGKIDRAGDMLVYDQTTGEDWSTHNDAARWNRIDLYDYVHGNTKMDRLYLTRATKE